MGELVKRLRAQAVYLPEKFSKNAELLDVLMKAADAIEELSKPRWIPVTDRCPEKSGDYIVFDDCRNLYVNEWHCLLKKWQYDDSRITHWMPLPQPPKEE